MPVIKNNTNRVLTLSDFEGNNLDVYPGNTIETPYFYTTIDGADVVTEEPYFEEIVYYTTISGSPGSDFTRELATDTDYLEVYNTSAETVMLYFNSKDTNPYVVPSSSYNQTPQIKDKVKRIFVEFPAEVTSGVYYYEYRNVEA